MVTTASHRPLIGISSLTAASGLETVYTYFNGSGNLSDVGIRLDGTVKNVAAYDNSIDSPTSTRFAGTSISTGFPWTATRTFGGPSGTDYFTDITYYNGLGLPEQECMADASPTGKDIVKPIVYDCFLINDAKSFLPYETPDAGHGLRRESPFSEQQMFHSSLFGESESMHAFAQRGYDFSPQRHLIREAGPGSFGLGQSLDDTFNSDSQPNDGRFSTYYYRTVSSEDAVLRLSIDLNGCLIVSGVLPSGSSEYHQTRNPDGVESRTFFDEEGRILLVRQFEGTLCTSPSDTYFVRDERGNLRWVVPPEGVSRLLDAIGNAQTYSLSPDSPLAEQWCYVYSYDARGNVISRQLPGSAPELTGYDTGDRAVITQDGRQRLKAEATLARFDQFGRLVEKMTAPFTGTLIDTAYTSAELNSLYSASGVRTFVQICYDNYEVPEEDESTKEFSNMPGMATGTVNSAPVGLKTWERKMVLNCMDIADTAVVRWFFYDHCGRLVQTCETRQVQADTVWNELPGSEFRITYEYDFAGNVTAVMESLTDHALLTRKTLDVRGHLLAENTTLDGNVTTSRTFSYDGLWNLSGLSSGSVSEQFSRNIQGWATGHSVSVGGNTIYSDKLHYYDSYRSTSPSRAGNIMGWNWSRTSGSQEMAYTYSYDNLSRLTGSVLYSGLAVFSRFRENELQYDRNGNLLSMQRTNGSPAPDNLVFNYAGTGNRLSSVTGFGAETTDSYTYDVNGNMTHDGRSNLDLAYNDLNLVGKVSRNGSVLAKYSYLADGTKLGSEQTDGSGSVYRGSLIYSKTPDGALSLDCALIPGGRIAAVRNPAGAVTGYRVLHHVTDHLGSVRAVVDITSGQVLETADYLPFGQRWKTDAGAGYTPVTDADNRWRFSGKEEQAFLGTNPQTGTPNVPYIDYGARMYDPATGRWLAPDPLAEKYCGISPYAYCGNNPVNFIDMNGMDWYTINSNGEITFLIKSVRILCKFLQYSRK